MSSTQRYVLLAVAAVIVVLAIVILPGGDDDKKTSGSTQAAAQTQPADTSTTAEDGTQTSTGTGGAEAEPTPPLLVAGKVTDLEATKGDTVRFRVKSDKAEEVHIHGYDIKKDLEPGKTETISFKATIEGKFEIEFENAGEQIAELTVEPG